MLAVQQADLLALFFQKGEWFNSGNAGMDDAFYDAACYTQEDLRALAEHFEALGRDWPLDHARRIYREIGDHEKYLELRLLKDVMKTPKKWEAFARKVKEMNLRRPTFQQEFAKKLPDWETF